MSESNLRNELLDLLRRDGLTLQLVIAATDLIAADANFNFAVAQHKGKQSDVDFIELVTFHGEVMDRCEVALREFSHHEMGVLSQQLERECSILSEKTRTLTGLL